MERSKEAGLSANAWLMRQLTENRPIVYQEGVLPSFLRLSTGAAERSTLLIGILIAAAARQTGCGKYSAA